MIKTNNEEGYNLSDNTLGMDTSDLLTSALVLEHHYSTIIIIGVVEA